MARPSFNIAPMKPPSPDAPFGLARRRDHAPRFTLAKRPFTINSRYGCTFFLSRNGDHSTSRSKTNVDQERERDCPHRPDPGSEGKGQVSDRQECRSNRDDGSGARGANHTANAWLIAPPSRSQRRANPSLFARRSAFGRLRTQTARAAKRLAILNHRVRGVTFVR